MKSLFLTLFLACSIGLTGCQSQRSETELTGLIQGTTYHIKIVQDAKSVELEHIRKLVEETFNNIDLKLSNYREDSEISRLNQQKTTDWLPVSSEIAELVDIAKQVYPHEYPRITRGRDGGLDLIS